MSCNRILWLSFSLAFACVDSDDLEFRSGFNPVPLEPLPHVLPLGPPRLDPPEPYELPCSDPDIDLPAGPIDPLGEWCECMGTPGVGPSGPMVRYCIEVLIGGGAPDVSVYMYCADHYGELADLVEVFRESCSPLHGGGAG
jgi:hypothetical protein